MTRRRIGHGLFWLSLLFPGTTWAQVSIVETPLFSRAAKGIGAQYREDVSAASLALLNHGDTAGAEAKLAQVRGYCDAQRRTGRRIVSVADSAEYDAWLAEHGDGTPTDWIDIACPTAYHETGYAAVAAGRPADALPWLERAIAIAPYFPDPRNERAFVYARLQRLPEALAAYRETLALAEAHPNAAYIKPLALRGIGYVLTELGDLDGAQRSYEASLAVDPGNATALSELDYIARQRKPPASTAMPDAPAPAPAPASDTDAPRPDTP